MARTMSLTRDFTSHASTNRDGYAAASPAPSGFSTRPRRRTESDGSLPAVSRRKSASNLLDPLAAGSDLYGVDDEHGADGRRRRRRDDDIAALIDFFRNQAPPSGNFMSIPYGYDGDDRGRWASKIKRISKRSRSMPRPRDIRLPDSAVSGLTTGGHRHIAISIPFDASPFGDAARSQYPVFGNEDTRAIMPRNASTHTYTNEKGVVTVLRTVDEGREPTTSATPSGSRSAGPWSSNHRPSGSLGRASLSTGPRSRGSVQSKPHDYSGPSTGPSKTPIFDQYRTIGKAAADQQRQGTSGPQSPGLFQQAAYPPRQSSMFPAPIASISPTSIDGMISPKGSVRTAAPSPSLSVPESAGTDDTEQAVVKFASPPKAKRVPTPLDFADDMEMGGLRKDRIKPHTPALAESPLLPPTDHPPLPPARSMSRRDIVRDRKRRDIEAMRSAKQRQQQQDQDELEERGKEEKRKSGHLGVGEENAETDSTKRLSTATAIHVPAGSINADQEDGQEKKPTSSLGPTLAPIMVVVDVEPDYVENKRPRPSRTVSDIVDHIVTDPRSILDTTDASAITPPVSGGESPPPKRSAMDRTSLSRRREWNATREQERKTREAKEAARAKAKQLVAAGMSYENVKASQTDKEILRLYEAYRDHRLREMERRVRRLERNGDVWLRALVPVLDSVNRTMAGNNAPPASTRDWASDDENAQTQQQHANGVKRHGSRRASLSQSRLLEELARRSDGEDWSSGSDDASGLGTVEPLMRELAGEARRRQRAVQTLGAGGDGRVFRAL